jgi:3-oxoacyl-[acyl-carrier protein] reductase
VNLTRPEPTSQNYIRQALSGGHPTDDDASLDGYRAHMTESAVDRVVVITGGNSGIGRGTALYFRERGFKVVIIARTRTTLDETARELGDGCLAIQADIGVRTDVEAAVAEIVDTFGHVDVLINNAAIHSDSILTTMPLDEAERAFRAALDINLTGVFLMSMAIAPHLSRPGGRIICLSTIGAFRGGRRPGQMAYVASKSGVHGLIHCLARELSPEGITVNGIAPGFIETPMTEAWTDERKAVSVADILVGRAGTPDDIAACAFYLASPEASFISGEILNVNGGAYFVH